MFPGVVANIGEWLLQIRVSTHQMAMAIISGASTAQCQHSTFKEPMGLVDYGFAL